MSERTDISFDAALMMALRADAQRELDSLPTPKQFEEIYPDTSQWDERMTEALKKKKHHPVLKRVLIAAWQKVSSCSNSSTTSTCMVSSSFNTKPGKSYRLEYSATFSYSDGRSETITGSTSR